MHQVDDLRERSVAPDLGRANTQGAVQVDRRPTTADPGDVDTGRLSPVTMDSSTSDSPSSTVPSTPIFEPGRTRMTSPTWTSAVGSSTSAPSRTTTAIGGAKSSRLRIAVLVRDRARISNQCPRSTNADRTAAA